MAWVKLDDQAPRNLKMLKAGPAACWLWVCGIAHSQSQLTDGFISLEVLPMIGVSGVTRCRRLAETLVMAGLFDRAEGGYRVHDYLEFNGSREEMEAQYARVSKVRAASGRIGGLQSASKRQANAKQTPSNDIQANSSPDPTRPDPTVKDPPPQADARSKRPIFTGQKLTVFEWMLDDCTKTLGNCLDQFDLHEWFFTLDTQAMAQNLVIPKRDGGVWLQAQLVAEAQRRGLPLVVASVKPARIDHTCHHTPRCPNTWAHCQIIEAEQSGNPDLLAATKRLYGKQAESA